MDLQGKNILVTGGSLGIGKETAKLLAECGSNVAITGRDESRLNRAAEECNAFPITADVGNVDDIERTYNIFMGKYGVLDCLINNAGIGGDFTTLEEVSLKDFQNVFGINVFGAALMASKAVPIFKKQNYGNIINIASTAGLKGFEHGTVYASSKFALRGMTQCWQAELRKYNIRVILINPSEVTTAFGNEERQERDAVAKKLTPREIAHAIKSTLEMADRGFIPELSVWATNPW